MPKVDEKTQRLLRADAEAIAAAALRAVDGERVILETLRVDEDQLIVRRSGRSPLVVPAKRVFVVGAGKAAVAMAKGAERVLGNRLSGGAVITTRGNAETLARVEVHEAGHPLPDAEGVAGCDALVRTVGLAEEGDVILALVSGGGSSLMARPVDGLTLEDLGLLERQVLLSGMSIGEINVLRRHTHRFLGGGLAMLPRAARVVAVVISDVLDDRIDTVSSGPWSADPSTWEDVADVLDGLRQVPRAIQELVAAGLDGEIADTPKLGSPVFDGVEHVLAASNAQALVAGAEEARRRGYRASVAPAALCAEAHDVGSFVGKSLRDFGGTVDSAAWLLGGETTVTVRGTGRGGRSQELALSAATPLRDLGGVGVLAFGSDGKDGPTDVAGGWVDGATCDRAGALFIDVDRALDDHDSHTVLDAVGGLYVTGPTRTNVADIAVVLRRVAT